ncbi:serine carboxypeptidase [Lactifluus volemus]|nr:serine carboxypeptidase [Lactifluus volemus]
MPAPTILLTILALSALIDANRIPFHRGVVGGVVFPDAINATSAKTLEYVLAVGGASTPIPGQLRVVENSGICETTPGVYQASGYGDLSQNESIWFWFFAARNNPDTAPLITWFNGGPGSSSMIGLFHELGPCRINNQSTGVDLNPMSWNNYANVLFIDQPVGTGFSYGNTTVGTSQQAAVDVWDFLQIWFADPRFKQYATRDFGIWTESYGGHYGPTFSVHFLEQNAAIKNGTVTGVPINLKVLGIGNGLTDPISQYPGYLTYAESNPYHPLVSNSVISSANNSWLEPSGCKAQIIACNNGGSNAVCSAAQSFCNDNILQPLIGDWDIYYVPMANPDPYPPALDKFLNDPAVTSKIGSHRTWNITDMSVYKKFAETGDWMRTSRPNLEKVINEGVRTIIYDGDADFILNFDGVEAMVASLDTKLSSLFKEQEFANFTVNGSPAGLYKNAGTFSYLRVFGAGHQVPAYEWQDVPRGAAALQMFTQIMSGYPLSGT